jgi:hypothetical protein
VNHRQPTKRHRLDHGQRYSALVVVQAAATIALGLLGLAGIAKVVDPQPTSGALAAAHLPSQVWLVRMLGLLELAAAVVGLAVGSVAAFSGALLYLGFAAFTLAAVRGDRPLQSCGCFGREDTPPTWIHFGFNTVSALSLAAVALRGAPTIPWNGQTGEVIGYLAFAGLGVFAGYLMLTALPQTLAVSRR